jgi:meiotically up-regulated gene 157 (Mug157) protein
MNRRTAPTKREDVTSTSALQALTSLKQKQSPQNQKQQRRRKKLLRKQSSCGGPIRLVMLGILGTLALTLMLGTILLYLFHYVVQTDDVSLQMLASSGSSSSLGVGIGLPTFPKITREDSTTTSTLLLSKEALDMCTKTLWHTLETTTIVLPGQETFVHTGDIDDLWLRDSAAQVHTLLVPVFPNGTSLVQQDAQLDRIVAGLIKRTAMYIRHDPYANAFRIDDTYKFSVQQKKMGRHDLISTWNYELDSGCYYIRMLYYYWKQSKNAKHAESVLRLPSVQQAVEIMVDVWTAEQRHELDVVPTGPLLDCANCGKPYRYPGLPRNGKGSPTNATAGLTWTGFRPSDDECKYHYLVPANMFAVVALQYVVELAQPQQQLWNNPALAAKAQTLANQIQQGIQEHAIVEHPKHGKIYAYEVDGLGNYFIMDDANVPSLLSIPYLGYDYDAEIYANTRRFIFSPDNPTYQQGTNPRTGDFIEGYGSPHMSARIQQNIWPMSLAMQGLTSDDVDEKVRLVETLVKASAGTGWMHESIDVRNPKQYTRSWFCWADSLFAELVLSLTDKCPNPSHKYRVLEWRDPDYVEGGEFAEN